MIHRVIRKSHGRIEWIDRPGRGVVRGADEIEQQFPVRAPDAGAFRVERFFGDPQPAFGINGDLAGLAQAVVVKRPIAGPAAAFANLAHELAGRVKNFYVLIGPADGEIHVPRRVNRQRIAGRKRRGGKWRCDAGGGQADQLAFGKHDQRAGRIEHATLRRGDRDLGFHSAGGRVEQLDEVLLRETDGQRVGVVRDGGEIAGMVVGDNQLQ